MREIKFRVWDKENNIYYNSIWNLCLLFGGIRFAWDDYKNSDGETMITDLTKESYELLQFTGLKDRNGKEIYEGDILMYRNNMSVKNPGVPFDSYHKVCFGEYDFGEYEDQEDGYGWYIQDVDVENYGSSLTPISSDLYEVIGNIYENPELLK